MLRLSVHLVLFVGLAFSAGDAHANCSSEVCSSVYVERLYITDNGLIYVATSGDETQLSCTAVSNVYVSLDTTVGNSNELYSTLLAAQLADKKVSMRLLLGSSNCTIRYMTIDRQ